MATEHYFKCKRHVHSFTPYEHNCKYRNGMGCNLIKDSVCYTYPVFHDQQLKVCPVEAQLSKCVRL